MQAEQRRIDELIICAVEKQEWLYDAKSKYFKDNVKRKNSWKQIATEIGLTEGMVVLN